MLSFYTVIASGLWHFLPLLHVRKLGETGPLGLRKSWFYIVSCLHRTPPLTLKRDILDTRSKLRQASAFLQLGWAVRCAIFWFPCTKFGLVRREREFLDTLQAQAGNRPKCLPWNCNGSCRQCSSSYIHMLHNCLLMCEPKICNLVWHIFRWERDLALLSICWNQPLHCQTCRLALKMNASLDLIYTMDLSCALMWENSPHKWPQLFIKVVSYLVCMCNKGV